MKWRRRRFLVASAAVTGAAAASGACWIAASKRRTARMLRELLNDCRRAVKPAPLAPVPSAWPRDALTLAWLGHATVLLNFHGITILTDPVFSTRVGLDAGIWTLGPKRFVAPALTPRQLPPIDVVLLSHAHRDHLDLPSLRQLPAAAVAVTARATRDLLEDTPLRRAVSLGWGDYTTLQCAGGELRIEAFEVKHWGRRWPSEQERGYNGYLISRHGRTLLFAGDTAYTNLFAKLRPRGPFDLAIMPIAAYNPWIRNHCTPEEALAMADMAGARFIVPVHHQTFKLSEEPMHEPLARLEAALQNDPARLALRQIGETFTLPA